MNIVQKSHYVTIYAEWLKKAYSMKTKPYKNYSQQELQQLFEKAALPIRYDFKHFYNKDLSFKVYYENNCIKIKPLNVITTSCLYRHLEDIWTFYNPDFDVYEDGFLRIAQKGNTIIINDAIHGITTINIKEDV